MIRPNKYITETCCRCKRPGWKHHVPFNLRTEKEQKELGWSVEDIKDAPKNAEKCYASLGSSIYEVVKEGKELSVALDKKVAFEFNERLVIVDMYSDTDEVIEKWWISVYGETPKETWAKR